MRFLPLILFVCLAYGQRRSEEYGRRRFEDRIGGDRMLKYRYDAQLVTGAPQSSKLTSGLRLIGDLHLHLDRSKTAFAQLKDINLQKLDKFVEHHSAMFNLQTEDSLLDGIEVDVDMIMITQLQKPFSFRWSKGKVTEVIFEPTEPMWSVNMKRGILSLFVVNLDKTYSPDPLDKEEQKGDRFNPYQSSYTVWEDTPVGYCLTTYTPVPPPPQSASDMFYLTKVRQYDSCLHKSPMSYVFNNFGVSGIPQKGESSVNHLNIQGDVSYSIEGDKKNFKILTAVGQSKIIFMPYGPKDGSVHTSINQTLMLINDQIKGLNDQEISEKRVLKKMGRMERVLKMELPVHMAQDLEPYVFNRSSGIRQEKARVMWSLQKMHQLLSWVANGTYAYPSEEVLMTMQTLMDMIRQSTNETLKKLMEGPMEADDLLAPLKKRILWDLLSTAGTTSASQVVVDRCIKEVEKVVDRPLPPRSCVSAITSVGLYTPPSEVVLLRLLELLERSEITQNDSMIEVTTLAMGSVMGRGEDMVNDILKELDKELDAAVQIDLLKTANEREDELQGCKQDLIDRKKEIMIKHGLIENKIIKAIFPDQNKRSVIKAIKMKSQKEAAVIIGALRNAHIPSTVHALFHILHEVDLPDILRILTAQALETFTNCSHQVLKELEVIQKNPTEPASMRIQAFRSMVNLGMPTPTLIRIASSIANEKESQVSTYIWSALTQLANTTFAPYRCMASQARAALPFLKPIEPGVHESQYRHILTQLANNASMLKEFNHISDKKTITVAEHAAYFELFGATNKALQVSMVSKGIPKVLSAMLGPNGFFTQRHSVFDLFKRIRRDVDSAKEIIDNIFDKLKIKSRDLPETSVLISVQLLNKVIRIGDFTDLIRTDLTELMSIGVKDEERKLKNGLPIGYQTAGMAGQFYMELPTEAGFPVYLQMGLTYAANVTGEMSSAVLPSIFKEKRGDRAPDVITGRLAIKPEIVVTFTGKMSVDGYLFEAGSIFHAEANLNSPLTINTTIDIKKRHYYIALSPPVSSSPVLKLALKPYVYSQAVANTIPKKDFLQEDVNRKPIFHTMQPIMISNGAKMTQVKVSFGEKMLGYKVVWQGQRIWRSLPSATAWPLLGRSNYALYIKPGVDQPPAIRLNVRYIGEPRYRVPAVSQRDPSGSESKGACDSWYAPFCYSTGKEDDINIPTPPLSDLPPPDSSINLGSLKRKMEKELKILVPAAPAEWGVVAVLDSSSQNVNRAMSLVALMQNWQRGHFQQAYVYAYRTPIPDYDNMPWTMRLQSRFTFPRERITVRDLMNPIYQQRANRDASSMSQRTVANVFFQQQLVTSVNNYAVQRLPSLDPQVIVDRILPEYVLRHNHSVVREVRDILKTLLPVSHQLKEQKDRLKDTFQLENLLLDELFDQTSDVQSKIMAILRRQKATITVDVSAITAIKYPVLKSSQAVLDFNAILERVDLVKQEQKDIWKQRITDLNKNQTVIQRLTMIITVKLNNMLESRRSNSAEINNLMLLVRQQPRVITATWSKLSRQKTIRPQYFTLIISQANTAINKVNQLIEKQPVQNRTMVVDLLLQAAMQQQIIVKTLNQFRFGLAKTISDFYHYAIKVQGKELLERGSLLMQQIKMDKACTIILPPDQQSVMSKLQHIDRLLMAIQHDHVTLPSQKTPWTGDSIDLQQAEQTLESVVIRLKAIRDQLEKEPEQSAPCVLNKLLDTMSTLQQKVAIFKRILLAQHNRPKLTDEYERLDDRTMRLVLSLTRLFRKEIPSYLVQPDPIHYPYDSLVINKVLLKLGAMSIGLQDIDQRLDKLSQGVPDPGSDEVQRYYYDVFKQCKIAQKDVEKMRDDVEKALVAERNCAQKMIIGSYADTYNKFISVYGKLKTLIEKSEKPLIRKHNINNKINELDKWMKDVQDFDANRLPLIPITPTIEIPQPDLSRFPRYPYDAQVDDLVSDLQDSDSDSSSSRSSEEKDQMKAISSVPVPRVQGVLIVANISFSNSDNSMAIQIMARKSLQQRLWELAQFFPESRDTCVAGAVQGQLIGLPALEKCISETELRLNTYNHVHIAVQAAKKMPRLVTLGMDKLMMKTFADHYDRSTVSEPKRFVNPNSLHAVLDFAQPIKTMDQFFMTPEQTLVVEGVPVPTPVSMNYPFQTLVPLPKIATIKATNGLRPGTCTLESGVVRTNDGAIYQLPDISRVKEPLTSLLAMDCSSERSFAITTWPANCSMLQFYSRVANKDKPSIQAIMDKAQIVEILGEEHRVELIPDYLGDKVRIDGKITPLDFGKPKVFEKNIAYDRPAVAMAISLTRPEGPIHVEYPLLGLDIHFSYNSIAVEMSQVFQYKLCGLCGNYDGEITREMEGPEGIVNKNLFSAARDFYRSYVISGNMNNVIPKDRSYDRKIRPSIMRRRGKSRRPSTPL